MKDVVDALEEKGFYIFNDVDSDVCELSKFIVGHIASDPSQLGSSSTRGGADNGMIEVKIDWKKFPENLAAKGKRVENEFANIIASCGQPSSRIVSKIYFNRNIYSTRGFHTDGQKRQYKMFTYLTDCDLKDGPYSLVPGSHRRTVSKTVSFWFNRIFSRNVDANTYIFDAEPNSIKVTGKMGTRFISDQNALHRGTPQTEQGTRVAWVIDSAAG